MKHILRSFSLGILTATLLISVIYYVGDDSSANEDNVKALTVEEATAYLKDEGFNVVNQQKWENINQTLADQKKQLESNQKEDAKKESNNSRNQEEEEDSPDNNPVTIQIESGMATGEVADLLEEEGIIDNASEFESYLGEHGYEKAVQIGTFEVNSAMNFSEIAETITR
ncbi:YceG-like family protein [Salinibacillus kushneri]|uniref:YceG-like family protein n=1 Tax=Salinibacillus kushneri TaxID=237682 RepID=A0A1I0FWV7_9BACI|nr:endolytic transglycosylase MltG [Salinibacillus kushneri]SET62773.1 YceG-like family protein [Salinibacillus kushneri]